MTDIMTIPEAAALHGVDVKRLRGAVWRENETGNLTLPIGCIATDRVQNDHTLETWLEKQRAG